MRWCDINGFSKMVVEEITELAMIWMVKGHEEHPRVAGWTQQGMRAKGLEEELDEGFCAA